MYGFSFDLLGWAGKTAGRNGWSDYFISVDTFIVACKSMNFIQLYIHSPTFPASMHVSNSMDVYWKKWKEKERVLKRRQARHSTDLLTWLKYSQTSLLCYFHINVFLIHKAFCPTTIHQLLKTLVSDVYYLWTVQDIEAVFLCFESNSIIILELASKNPYCRTLVCIHKMWAI